MTIWKFGICILDLSAAQNWIEQLTILQFGCKCMI